MLYCVTVCCIIAKYSIYIYILQQNVKLAGVRIFLPKNRFVATAPCKILRHKSNTFHAVSQLPNLFTGTSRICNLLAVGCLGAFF